MLNKNIKAHLPAERATKIKAAVIIGIITSALVAFSINSYASDHAAWMVPAIWFCGWQLYRAIATGKVEIRNAGNHASAVRASEDLTSPATFDQEAIPAPMVAGVFFSHAEATTARGGYDDGSSIIYGTNANGSVTPYAM